MFTADAIEISKKALRYHQFSIKLGRMPDTFARALRRAQVSADNALSHCLYADLPPLDAHRDPDGPGYLCGTCQRRHDDENSPLTGRWGDE